MIFQDQNSTEFQSIEAEQALLGILLVWPDSFLRIVGMIEKSDFFNTPHQDIFQKICELHQSGSRVSPIALKPYFENRTDFPPVYIADLAASVISSINLESYAQTIKKYAEKRRILEIIEDYRAKALESVEPENLKTELIGALENTVKKSIYAKTKRQAANDFIDSLSMPAVCNPVGISSLDKSMGGGLYEGFTYGFAGGEKSGKTTTAQTISHNLNQAGVLHAYIALEMGSRQIEQRNIARELGINSLRFLDQDRLKHARAAADYACTVPDKTIYLDMAGCSFEQIKSEIMRLVAKEKIKGFILDYWQLVGGCDSRTNKSEFLFDIAQWIAGYCRRNSIFSIVLSQLNRQGQLLGSAGLERACDQLYVLGKAENSFHKGIWMNLTHSRYTPAGQLGTEENPKFEINYKSGPFLEEIFS